MAMMRRGPLDRYRPEWVLRQAAAQRVTGTIEFHGEPAATLFLDDGQVYAARRGVGDATDGPEGPDEVSQRLLAVELLARVLPVAAGWYYHDPLARHPARGAWAWEVEALLSEARRQDRPAPTLSSWSDRPVAPSPVPSTSITLDADAWTVVVALTGPASANELLSRLRWSPSRLLAALDQLDQRGALTADGRPPPATTGDAVPSRTGPLLPPPDWTPDDIEAAEEPEERPRRRPLLSLRRHETS
ncbi:MAG: hypothetical protein KDA98_13545 [Acidimicrobiales bacterium]|nr:hypothetical protein [Acidimicrobiales bacterium]